MRIIIDNNITILDPTPQVIAWADNHLVLNNPEYYKLKRLGKWTGRTPKTISLYESFPDKLILPFGCLRPLYSEFKNMASFEAKIHALDERKYVSSLVPYKYQENAIQAIVGNSERKGQRNGVVIAPCGSGKSMIGLEIIARIGGRALWLTHTQDLLNQSKSRAESILDIGDGTYGTITEGKINVGTHITFATIQTLSRIDLEPMKDMFDIIVGDEIQHAAGSPTRVTQFYKVISKLSARYKVGLTATLKRSDGLEKSIYALIGGTVYEVTRQDVKDTTCPLRVKCIDTGYSPNEEDIICADGTIDYNAVVNDLIRNEKRTDFLLSVINSLEGSVLVLANRIEYLETLQKGYRYKSVCLSTLGTSKKAKEQRKQALAQLNNGELDCVFSTWQIAAEGLDIPSLKYVVFATPEKFSVRIEQSCGRVMRKAKDKAYGTVIDFCDDFPMYKSWARSRKAIYKKLEATIDTIPQ